MKKINLVIVLAINLLSFGIANAVTVLAPTMVRINSVARVGVAPVSTVIQPPILAAAAQPVEPATPAAVAMYSGTSSTPSIPASEDCYKIDQYIPDTIDMEKLRATWLDWNNDLRVEAGLPKYVLKSELDWSAQNWSDRAKRLGTITHKRDGSNAYYDYKRIVGWFKDLKLEFKNVNGTTMTENIGWGYYKCPADGSDCTPAMTKAIKTTFDFFAGEKGKQYDAHWRSLMQPNFRQIGLGLALDKAKNKYYLTIHYGTEIISDPVPICKP